MGDAEKTVAEMMKPEAQLAEVYAFAADLYPKELAALQQQSHDVSDAFWCLWIDMDHQICLVCSTKCACLECW